MIEETPAIALERAARIVSEPSTVERVEDAVEEGWHHAVATVSRVSPLEWKTTFDDIVSQVSPELGSDWEAEVVARAAEPLFPQSTDARAVRRTLDGLNPVGITEGDGAPAEVDAALLKLLTQYASVATPDEFRRDVEDVVRVQVTDWTVTELVADQFLAYRGLVEATR